jgi:hypothetical protein
MPVAVEQAGMTCLLEVCVSIPHPHLQPWNQPPPIPLIWPPLGILLRRHLLNRLMLLYLDRNRGAYIIGRIHHRIRLRATATTT